MEKNDLHQLHITIPSELYEELKNILPERGMVTGLVRKFLVRYVTGMNKLKLGNIVPSPFEKATSSIIEEDIERR